MSVDLREKRLQSLSPAKRALLLQALRQKEGQGRQEPRIPQRAETGHAPLAFAQERLWFLDQLEPGRALYNIPVALRIEGPLEVHVLTLSFGEIVRRHEALRTIFDVRADVPVQLVQPAAPFELPVVDLSELPETTREATALHLADEEASRPFDLSRGPLLRGLLMRLAAPGDSTVHAAVLTMHHIVSDGWSMGILVREISSLYPAFAEGGPSPLPELPVQYGDFAAWQRSWLHGELLESEVSFWRRQLAGLPPLLELPTDRPRPAMQSYRGGTQRVILPTGLTHQAEALARREGATVFMVLLAGFQTLLARHSGQDDLAVGTPVAGRNRLDTENLIGFFVNTLVLRGDLSANPSFHELLGRLRETTLAAYAHQDVPFERLVQELTPERSLAHTPLFQVMFALQNAPIENLEIRDLRLRPMGGAGTTAKFDLTLTLEEYDGRLAGTVEYATDLFDGTTIDRLIACFERLLTAALIAPELSIAELPLLDAAERWQLLHEWNDTCAEGLAEGCLHQHVAAQAARTPDAVAVESGSERWTYRRLISSARHLACHLRKLGVGPEVIVGLSAERCPAMVVGMLAVLEAGGAWLPLDPTYPAERLAFMLDDSGARFLLVQEHLLSRVPAADRSVVLLDARWDADEHGEEEEGDRRVEVTPAQLAYVIYTSGSTGRPKGVMVPHRGVVNRLRWAQQVYRLDERDAVLQKASFGFDFSVWECFAPLSSGARLVLAAPGRQGEGSYLVRTLREHRVTFVHFVPSMLSAFLGEEDVETCVSLRQVFSGGEALTPELRDLALARLPAPLDNQYGPTEISIDTTRWVCAPGQEPHRVPIGRPIGNGRLYVVDSQLRPMPTGVAGELLVGGVGVTRGYLHRPALTAERFVPDPFATEPGARLYHTGDLGRWTREGTLEFLGRIDHQVKLRGFRIELGEIETALAAFDRVREAVVVLREDRSNRGNRDRRLVAYVTGDLADVSPDALRQALCERLPDYMVPSAFVTLEALPLTPNGKVDRNALPAPEWQGTAESYVAPRTPVEEVLAGIWAGLLGLERVGAADNFFDLGGHSLLATRVMSHLRSTFGVEMALREIFEAPRLADLAARVEAVRRNRAGWGAPPLMPVPREGILPLSFAQQRLWFLDRLAPGNPFYNMYSPLRLSGPLDAAALQHAFQEIVERHEVLRTTFPETDGRPCQVIDPAPVFQLSLVDMETLPEEDRRAELTRLSRLEAVRPFDLARGPLFRATLIRHASCEHTLLVNLHHVISDGWSMGILFAEIASLYGAFSQGRPSPLPNLAIQYADFALWQREFLQGERLEAELGYWRDQLAGLPETLELPADHPRPTVDAFRGAFRTFTPPAAPVRALTELARRYGATLSMATLAGYQAVLGRYAGQDDVAVGMAIANRTRREIEGLIGFFVNTLVLRSDLSPSSGFGALLARVRETALAAYAHQDLPFDRLVEELQPERKLSRNPLIQVMFGYQNFPRAESEVRGLTLSFPEAEAMDAGTAKFDLTLFLLEEGERLRGTLEYNSDLFEPATVQRLLEHFENLLTTAVADPDQPMAFLPLLNAAEIHQLATEWTVGATGLDASLQELFEAQVRRAPEAPVLVFGEGGLSYGELNRRANWLAHRLHDLGVGPESCVGLCLERSPELVIGLLGILKAGGAYVPLDPDYPRERLTFMVEDSGLRVLVGQTAAVRQLPENLLAELEVLLLDVASNVGTEENPPIATSGDSLAYVMYTSGSTGRPKGVAVPHRAVARLVRDTDFIELGPDQAFLQFAPVSFDASTLEIWGPLLNGGRLVIPPPHVLSLEELGGEIERHGVTTLWLTAGLFHQFVENHLDLLRPVRQLLAGGDVLSVPHVRRVLAELPETRLINGYGPTENTTFTCCHPVQGMERLGISVPIGKPIAHTWVHLLDPHGQLVPFGVAGELCAGGAGLARGYLRRPNLTAERFVPDPLTGSGNRLYRTGDLARRLPDGTIEFLGRIDQQVKVRGFRIEPGEIEARLGEHPAVLHNVVMAREDISGDKRLVAYVVQDPSYGLPQGVESEVQTEQVSQWSEIFDDIYRREAAESDPTFNIIGWDSSYTGKPLPGAEMEEWLADTIDRITELQPRRVLEIGCGTGMILFRIAPGCEVYTGTDISARVLGYVESHLDAAGVEHSRVQLLRRPAERFDGMAAGSYDTVILNSVVQYFPSADYLGEVIARAAEVVRPGGAIFLGDLRNLPLLDAFDTSVELFQANPETPLPHLRQRLHARRLHENELSVAPAFFQALRQRVPRIGRVEIYPKHGEAHNELTAFRYQVVLRIGEAEETEIPFRDWQAEGLTLDSLRLLLEKDGPDGLSEGWGLRNIPNARTAEAAAAARLLREAEEGIETTGDLRRRAAEVAVGAVDPQDLWNLGRELPYEIELSQANPGFEGRFEAVLRRRREGAGPMAALLPAPRVASTGPLSQYTNNPLQGRFARQIAPELRAFLAEKLPDYMVPYAFVLLDTLPLSPNGKVDRRRLPAPDLTGVETGRPLAAPRSQTEERLLEIWRQLLGIERIGVDDDFFVLGGHSLLATQAVSRVRKELGVELPLRTFFEAPTVAALALEVEALRRTGGTAEVPPIVPVKREGPLPLSFAQERLWFLHLLDRRVLAYNESAAFRLRGWLDEAAFRWSLDEVVRRHESLRTVFSEVESWGMQQVLTPIPFDLPSVDLRSLPEPLRETEIVRLAIEQARHPFDLARGPLVRGLLARLEEQKHAVLFFFHHIVFDGWSTPIFVRELSTLYAARVAGEPSPLPELPVQYADFAVWQRQWLQGQVLEEQLSYWRERLTGVPVLDLPTDHPRRVRSAAAGDWRPVLFAPELTEGLRALSLRQGTTLFMTLLAAFQALLYRRTGQDDVVVGSPIANRNRSELEDLIGFFVNMLVLRTDLSGNPGFAELVDRVRETALGAYAHQDLPFEKLVGELQPERDMLHNPLFQVGFQLLKLPPAGLELPGLSLHPFSFATRFAKFDLNLALTDEAERISGVIDYDTGLFEVSTVDRLVRHLETLLTAAVADPSTFLSDLPLLTAEEVLQLRAWNETATPYPLDRPLHAWIGDQVERSPDAVAVDFEGEEVTYRELDRRANRLAHQLHARGCGPESRVGVLLERSCELLVALLGILKAGAAYVPLDPDHPIDRLAFQERDARLRLVLTCQDLASRLPGAEERLLFLEHGGPAGGGLADEAPPLEPVDPDHPAYVLYTSGSTGRPKGAVISHRAIVNRLLWMQEALRLTAADRVLQKTPFSFDVSVWELFWPLMTGARLVVAIPGGHRDSTYLTRLIARQEITVLHFVPSMLQLFLEEPGAEECRTLRDVVCSGEALPAELARRFAVRLGHARLHNLYGPTEAAVDVTSWVCEVPSTGDDRGGVPIGRPIANTRIHLLDLGLLPVPVGVPGELFIGGVNLARGYVERPDLTAERFLPDPIGGEPGERVYRTGDLARWRHDGVLEFLGRTDHQVKIRGFRIELGEIEAVLLTLPGVREAVVLARAEQFENGGYRLVAYVVGEAAVDALRQALRERLPEYMVPATFVLLDALPLNSNGKVDRKALPAPEWQSAAKGYVAPRTPVEEVLAGTWAELLGLDRVGVADHFFALGGHSLLATRTVSRLREAFGVEIPLRDLFEAPTLGDLAVRVETALREGTEQLAPPLVPVPREASLPLSFAQQRLWFIDQLDPGTPLYNVPVALRVDGPLDAAVLAHCLGEILRRHEALRTVFAAPEGSPVQVIQAAAPFFLPTVDLSALPSSRREAFALRLAGDEADRPFDLTIGPLFRGVLLRLGVEDHVTALTMHHIVSDGWSMGILVREIAVLYSAFAAGKPSPLPELPVQYADFSAWQRSWLHGEVLQKEISYWREQFAGLPPLLELPTDRPRPAVQSLRGTTRPMRLPADLTRQVNALGRREGATLFMVLLAGFQALLSRYSGRRDLATGTPVAGRNQIEIEGLIGFFVNTLVLRGNLTDGAAGEPSFRELLGRIRGTALAAYMHQDVPFEKLVQELAPERNLAHTPLFQVMFVLQNAPGESLEIRDLSLRPIPAARTTEKFDLTLNLSEQDGELYGSVGYASDLFDRATIDRLIGHFERFLAAAVVTPDELVVAVPFLSPAEHAQLLREWNDTQTAGLGEGFFHREVATQAARAPFAVAVELGAERWTYGRLMARARSLARHLRKLGVGPDAIVGLCAGRSPLQIVGLLAVLEAGGAWLPLDPDDPVERLAFLLDDAGAQILLIEEHLRERVPSTSLPVVPLGAHQDDVDDEEEVEALRVEVSPDHLAYVIYTSGSTGRPKGVAIRHGSLMNLARALRVTAYSGIAGALRIGVNASFSFDASVQQVVQLAWGHTLHLLGQDVRLDPAALVDSVRRLQLDVLDCTPSQLRFLLEAGLGTGDATPALVLVGGEAVDADLLGAALARPQTSFWNVYGPTECTIDTTATPFVSGVPPSHIGRPLPNVQAYIVAGWGGLAPLGVSGELQVGGAGLARGYLRQPDLTAERFIPDPFSGDSGGRLYRTGDLVRRLPDGSLDFLGRLDHQVKVRGFRIELGEIEAAIVALTGVSQAAVIIREDKSGDRRLVAYVVGDFTVDALRTSLRERLPLHMVPAAFVTLPAFPLSPNGKVDRKALPAPEWQSNEESYLAPRTPVEEILAGIWAELLDLERIGVDDRFFDLGGHSLLATRVTSRLRAAFGVEMPLRDLFEAPVLADLAVRVEAALRGSAGRLRPPLVPMLRQGPLPLSFAQQRLWFIDQLKPGSPLYNMPVALRVEGPLDARVLALCLGEIVRRHEALRSVFPAVEGVPVQVILPVSRFVLPVVDLSGLPSSCREDLALRLVGNEAVRPFDLIRGPLLRGVLLRLAEEDYVFALTMHHIVSDGWSMGILIREVTSLYPAFAEGQPSPLPELTVQYGDFAAWQHSWMHGEHLESEVSFWRRQLAGLPPLLGLPSDRPRPAIQSYRGVTRPVFLPPGLTSQAEALARREGATVFMVLLAGFQALLARHSGQDDLAVGTPVAGRNQMEVEGLIGFFVNTLVLRGDLSGKPSFRELLGRVRETALAAHTHQNIPFEKLVEELAPERSLAHTPLFQVMFVLQNAPAESLEIRDLRLRPFSTGRTAAKFDLSLSLVEHDGGLLGAVQHASDLFDATTIDRLILHYERLLTVALTDPQERLADLEVFSAAERAQLLVEWNDTGRKAPALPVHRMFAEQAARTPGAVAVRADEGSLTYSELAARVQAWAGRLGTLGAGPEQVVAVCLERSADLVAALLAVLASGAAYLPLDPRDPEERRIQTLEDARPLLLLTRRTWTGGSRIVRTLCVEDLPAVDATAPGPDKLAGSLAYVLYTSGSTGRPKGVEVDHAALSAYLGWISDVLDGAGVLWLPLLSSVTFDASLKQLFVALLRGATVRVVSEAALLRPSRLLEILDEAPGAGCNTVPAVWESLLDAMEGGEAAAPASLGALFLGGERLPEELVARTRRLLPDVVIYNLYGPTEATANATWARLDETGRPVLGRPVGGGRIVLADRHLWPVPLGVVGELCIGGAGLARGYRGRPEQTAERFVPNPFGARGERLYRSGDLARYLADGTIEYLGRVDHQVKLRGFRIELGEIEAALFSLPGVREAVVLAREGRDDRSDSSMSGDRRLVAYVAGDLADVSPDALRQALRERLPDYMVPAAFVVLKALPLTPNGKVDRKALPAPEYQSAKESYVAPRTMAEGVLASMWAELLGLERTGVTDDFFGLGGHSLLAVRLMARIEQTLGVKLPVSALFEAPTVERLAALIHRREASARRSPLVRLHPGGAGRPFFVVHPVGGDVFAYVELARKLGAGRPVYGLQAVAETAEGNGHPATMEELAAQYLAAVREVQPEGPYFLAGWSLGAVIAYEMAQQIESSGGSVALLTMIDPSPPESDRNDLDGTALLVRFAFDLVRLSGRRVAFGEEALEGLAVEAAIDHLFELGQREGVLPPNLDKPRLLERFNLFCRHARALECYVAYPYGGRVTLFRASTSLAPGAINPTAGWSSLIRSVEPHLLEADHYSMLRGPALDRLVEHLRNDLEKAEASAGQSLGDPPGLTRSAR